MAELRLHLSEDLMALLRHRAVRDWRTPEEQALFYISHALRTTRPLYQRAHLAGELYEELQRLHLEAGLPSSRAMAHLIWQRQHLRVSHTTINLQLGGKAFHSWRIVEAIVRALDGDVDKVRKLWAKAR